MNPDGVEELSFLHVQHVSHPFLSLSSRARRFLSLRVNATFPRRSDEIFPTSRHNKPLLNSTSELNAVFNLYGHFVRKKSESFLKVRRQKYLLRRAGIFKFGRIIHFLSRVCLFESYASSFLIPAYGTSLRGY